MDWPDERHDANRGMMDLFNIVKKNLITLKKEFLRPKINIIVTVFKENYATISELIKCSETLADVIVIDRFIPYQDRPQIPSGKEINALFKEIHNLKKKSKIEIQVYDPIYYTLYPEEGTSRANCKVRLFTSNTGQFGQCPFHPSRFATVQEVIDDRENEALPSECEPCEFSDTCHGGCPAIRLVKNGTLTKKDPYCIKE